jgi:hypothetical protein
LYYEESTQLSCYVILGDSPLTFQWLFQNDSIEHLSGVKVESANKRSLLTIDSVSAKHAGEYTCKVINEAGFTTITTTLVVKGSKNICSVLLN